jgi:energy-coupling factor transport system ATP-binding protein
VVGIIKVDNVTFAYHADSPDPVVALADVNLEIERGQFVAIVGHNGSGKSTLAKHLNALLLPTSGDVVVDGLNTKEKDRVWDIRSRVGMVFQNPDNQLVATVVEDDIAFGAENLGVPPEEIQRRVDQAVVTMELETMRNKAPHMLSGGQKQRVAVAGILAMRSDYIVMDEPTSLLAPKARADVLKVIGILRSEGISVTLVTHFMNEATEADKVVVMDGGRIVMQGTPSEIFSRAEELRALHLDVPQVTQLAGRLAEMGLDVPSNALSVKELVDALC